LAEHWQGRTTTERTRASFPEVTRHALPSDNHITDSAPAFPLFRMAGTTLNYQRLLHEGLPGLKRDVQIGMDRARSPEHAFFLGVLGALDLVQSGIEHYAREAVVLAEMSDPGRCAELKELASALEKLLVGPPQTFLEAAQLFWIYAIHSGTWNYGRLDVVLGPFLAADLESGCLDEEKALRIVRSLWRLIMGFDNMFNNRVYIGGKGRPDEKSADLFARLAIEASRLERETQPQLSLRFYQGMNPELMKQALDTVGSGCTFPMFYNDDVNIPAIQRSFGVSEDEAVEYAPFGCGEAVLGSLSADTPNGLINLLKVLGMVLHEGRDDLSGLPTVPSRGSLETFVTFDKLWDAYAALVEHYVEQLALVQKLEYEVIARDASFLLISALSEDCLSRGRALLDGGIRYLGGTLEAYGNINTADSLTAIKKCVYDERVITLQEIVDACDANFVGFEPVRNLLLSAPKYGNDNPEADAMASRVHEHLCQFTAHQACKHGLHHYLIVIINNSANVDLGWHTAASPDGRLARDAMANANNPFPGMDTQGTTAFLSSLVKLDPSLHAGSVQNMKFSKDLFDQRRPKLEALLNGYFRMGGSQAMLSVVSPKDLESAMREPEKWGHLMVRMGGYSARFVELEERCQLEVLRRTLHE
jgi:pyruvate-formate lyase